MEEARTAVEWLERARVRQPDDYGDLMVLAQIAPAALEAADREKAERYARRILEAPEAARRAGSRGGYHGLEQAYIGQIVLGKCAMIDGDVDSAEQHLLGAAAAAVPSPVLGTFGTDTDLAARLLAAGRGESVLAYLENFRSIWKRPLGGRTLDAWLDDIREGRPWPAPKDVAS